MKIAAWIIALVLPLPAAELTIAAAADLQFAMDELVKDFEGKQPEAKVRVSYGSSGNFHAQIRNGAPYDIYFSADIRYPALLAEQGLALEGNVFTYAIGRIVLWVPEASTIDVEKLGIGALAQARQVAIANPRHAPYGVAAEAAMRKLGVHAAVEPRLVLGENVAQAAQFVQSGAADIGVIALSLALAPQMKGGRWWEVPVDAYPRMDQGGMILKTTKSPELARAFRDFVLAAEGRVVLDRFGFFLPGKE
jgi:molybdate transport system substrate-binding protein